MSGGTLLSFFAYLGLADLLAGTGILLRPGLLKLTRRRSAVPFFVTGLVLATVGAWWPHRLRPTRPGTLLATALPSAQFGERHTVVAQATVSDTWQAIREVTADEIRLFRLLTWIRAPRLPGAAAGETILDPDWDAPILDVALRTDFVLLGERPGRELVVGTVVCCGPRSVRTAQDFLALSGPGYARAAMDFRIDSLDATRTRITTTTYVLAAGTGARRRFGLYWSYIYPGSALIRRGWLAAIRRRAEVGGG